MTTFNLNILFGLLAAGATGLYAGSCKSDSGPGGPDSPAVTDTTTLGVETQKPNTDYKPAFEGQTRIRKVTTATTWEGKAIATNLNSPWGITTLPDGRLLITEKKGTLRIATTTGNVSAPIGGVPAVNAAGQGGLLGVTIDPAFEQNRMIYWVFSEKTADGNLTAVAKGKLSADEKSVEQATVIYEATPAYKSNLHYGGRILFDKTGNLIVTTGERSDLATRPLAQSLDAALGKVLRITTEGKPAPGNPFEGRADARPEIYSYGHRNVQSLAFHPVTGDIWEGEFGPRGGDEINRIQPGKNYGWPTITYGIEYAGPKVGEGITQKDGMEQPVYYWDPVLSPSGMTFYTGNRIPEWQNNLFICGLSSMHIARLVIDNNNKVTGEERLLADQNQRFRDITQGKDGALYAVTDMGKLYRIDKK
ncbi:PQQ-dependent sugar dehydrogenase [Flavihumibacter petaseus]|uniref:Aldose sugar dehydrogenase n=1 Tax=Flavihumibacter petaseus NBRC 106054 TaxID=1220578 RepID=A0A0E9N299_9BACT|nr:PQQ-dependent sugar dehydrogenase [Flavihumibacter petaseus]GAO43445.1 aldose sugar dehydrogenase [Flavihumibacter petaseus NBRC 106054]